MSANAPRGKHIFLSCGEASGDRYGAALIAALRSLDPELRFSALGGDGLAVAGAEVIESSHDIAVMGIAEVVRKLPRIWRVRRRLWRYLAETDIDLVVPIDFPGFNARLAGRAKRLGLPVFYLIPPQMWAWGRWRLAGFQRRVDRVGAILPFEAEFFGDRGLDVFSMGHPLMDDYGAFAFEQRRAERELRFMDDSLPLTIAFIPGSRRQEVERLVPVMKVAALMAESWLEPRRIRFLLSAAPGIDPVWLHGLADGGMEIRDESLPLLLEQVDLALVCSGTASLETALAGVPHEIVYRAGWLNYAIARRLVKTSYMGLANLVLDDSLVREHTQGEVSPIPLASCLLRWLNAPAEREHFYRQARRLRTLLGEAGVWSRTAREILDFMGERDGIRVRAAEQA